MCPVRAPVPTRPSRLLSHLRALLQILQHVMGYLTARELGVLEATCSYFIKSGLTDRIARHFLRDIPRAKGLKPDLKCAPGGVLGGQGRVGRPGAAGCWLQAGRHVHLPYLPLLFRGSPPTPRPASPARAARASRTSRCSTL